MSGALIWILLCVLPPELAPGQTYDPDDPYWRFALELPESEADRARREHERNIGILVMAITISFCGLIACVDRGGRGTRWAWSKLKGCGGKSADRSRRQGRPHGPH